MAALLAAFLCLLKLTCGRYGRVVGRSSIEFSSRGFCLGMQEARKGDRLSPVALWTSCHGWHFRRLKEVVDRVLMRNLLN